VGWSTNAASGAPFLAEEVRRLMIKRRSTATSIDPSRHSPHSLRAGFMTEAGRQGIPLPESMALSGHKTPSVAIRYHRVGDVLLSRAAKLAG
jgi:site-specific recombinase XerD